MSAQWAISSSWQTLKTVFQCVVRHLTCLSPQRAAEQDIYSTAKLLNYKCLLTTPFGQWIKGSNVKKKMKKTLQRPSSWSNRKFPQGLTLKAIAPGKSDVHVFGKASQLCNPVKWLCLAHWSGNNSRGWFGKTGQILPSETLLQEFSWGCNPNICLTLTKPTEITHRILHLPAGGVIQAIGPHSHLNLPLVSIIHRFTCLPLPHSLTGGSHKHPQASHRLQCSHNSHPQLPLSSLLSARSNVNLRITLQRRAHYNNIKRYVLYTRPGLGWVGIGVGYHASSVWFQGLAQENLVTSDFTDVSKHFLLSSQTSVIKLEWSSQGKPRALSRFGKGNLEDTIFVLQQRFLVYFPEVTSSHWSWKHHFSRFISFINMKIKQTPKQ